LLSDFKLPQVRSGGDHLGIGKLVVVLVGSVLQLLGRRRCIHAHVIPAAEDGTVVAGRADRKGTTEQVSQKLEVPWKHEREAISNDCLQPISRLLIREENNASSKRGEQDVVNEALGRLARSPRDSR
jgi:hypothetical protein